MKTPFSAIITPNSVSFTTIEGRAHNVQKDHAAWNEITDVIKKIERAKEEGHTNVVDSLHATLTSLVDVGRHIVNSANGKVVVRDGAIFYNDVEIHNSIVSRILTGLNQGYTMRSYIQFLENAMENPSKTALAELYQFMEANSMGISDDGYIIAYKKIRENYYDIWSNTYDNSPGQILEMPRNAVDDNRNRTCSTGFHFCSIAYLPQFGCYGGNRVIIVKINPRDVVSIPSDYYNAKARCCRYEVISEYTGDDIQDLLGTKAIWSDTDFAEYRSEDDYEDDDTYYDNYDYQIDEEVIVKTVRGGVVIGFEETAISNAARDWVETANAYDLRFRKRADGHYAYVTHGETRVILDLDDASAKAWFDDQAEKALAAMIGDAKAVESNPQAQTETVADEEAPAPLNETVAETVEVVTKAMIDAKLSPETTTEIKGLLGQLAERIEARERQQSHAEPGDLVINLKSGSIVIGKTDGRLLVVDQNGDIVVDPPKETFAELAGRAWDKNGKEISREEVQEKFAKLAESEFKPSDGWVDLLDAEGNVIGKAQPHFGVSETADETAPGVQPVAFDEDAQPKGNEPPSPELQTEIDRSDDAANRVVAEDEAESAKINAEREGILAARAKEAEQAAAEFGAKAFAEEEAAAVARLEAMDEVVPEQIELEHAKGVIKAANRIISHVMYGQEQEVYPEFTPYFNTPFYRVDDVTDVDIVESILMYMEDVIVMSIPEGYRYQAQRLYRQTMGHVRDDLNKNWADTHGLRLSGNFHVDVWVRDETRKAYKTFKSKFDAKFPQPKDGE